MDYFFSNLATGNLSRPVEARNRTNPLRVVWGVLVLLTLLGGKANAQTAPESITVAGACLSGTYVLEKVADNYEGTGRPAYQGSGTVTIGGTPYVGIVISVYYVPSGPAWVMAFDGQPYQSNPSTSTLPPTSGWVAETSGVIGSCTGSAPLTVTTCVKLTFYVDGDGDGFGNANSTTLDCSAPAGYVTNATDCDDTQRLYADGDGDGFGAGPAVACGVANNTDCNDAQTLYADGDGDGFGSATKVACNGVTTNTDCDDTQRLYADGDGDGFGAGPAVACGVANNTDCDDAQTLYADADGDGFGSTTKVACNGVTNATDCNDAQTLYADGDGDGFGSTTKVACNGVATNTDCDDTNAAITPTIMTVQPTPVAVEETESALFKVTATGTRLTYQWYFNGTTPNHELKKETSASLSLKNVKLSDAGTYYVRVTGVCGSVLSGGATLSVASKKSRLAAPEADEPILQLTVEASPNPTTGLLKVGVTGAGRQQSVKVRLYNLAQRVTGEWTMVIENGRGEKTIDMGRAGEGLYFLSIEGAQSHAVRRVMKVD